MCFSATASFSAAAVISCIGAASVWKASRMRTAHTMMFAAIPLMFAAQQAIEGFLWLEMANPLAGACRPILIHGFVGFAVFFWPVYAPISAYLIEPDPTRRRMILACAVCGAGLSIWMIMLTLDHPYQALVRDYGMVYTNKFREPWFHLPIYVLATTLSFSFSSHRIVRLFSYVVLAGFVVAALFFKNAYVSVWCFFAAMASMLVYVYVTQSQDPARRAVN